MPDGINVRYPQKIADQTCCSAAPAAVDRAAVHYIRDYQEVIHESLGADKIEFFGEAIFNRRRFFRNACQSLCGIWI